MKVGLGVLAAVFASIVVPVALFVLIFGAPAAAESCGSSGPGVRVNLATLPGRPIAGYSGVQLENAAYIMNAGQALGLDVKAQTIGVMTAMGESGLEVLDRGDGPGPDSRGLFQQRDNGAWGSYRDRMDPTTSATNFFKALMRVKGWGRMTPTMAAHTVQRNKDPNHYARFWDGAAVVVKALAGTKVVNVASDAPSCETAAPPPTITAGRWIRPADGEITSPFGMRWGKLHAGVDFGAPCSAPIRAVADGMVVEAGPVSGYGNLIRIDHGAGVVTAYAHMFDHGVLVRAGTAVVTGWEIGRVGNAGHSFGCHLHFEVRVNGKPVDPMGYMGGHGVQL